MIGFILSIMLWIFAACVGFYVLKLALAAIAALAGVLLSILPGKEKGL